MDLIDGSAAWHISHDDECYFARDYISKGGYKSSDCNGLISNLKKHPRLKGTKQWYYKQQAIQRLGSELATLFRPQVQVAVAAIPTSKRRDDPEFDSRIDDALRVLQTLRPQLRIVEPILRSVSTNPTHLSEDRPGIDEVFATLEWTGYEPPPDVLVFVDDVITTGATFKACQRLVRQYHPALRIGGAFWARTVWPNPATN